MNENNLTGKLPSELGDLDLLKTFYIKENPLTGAFPSDWADRFPNLKKILLHDTLLSGTLASKFCQSYIDRRYSSFNCSEGLLCGCGVCSCTAGP